MALTTFTVNKTASTPGGIKVFGPEPAAATDGFVAGTSDFQFANDGKTLLVVRAGATPTTIAFTFPNTSYAGVTYAASGAGGSAAANKATVFGPFPTSLNDSSGNIVGTSSSNTSIFWGTISIG